MADPRRQLEQEAIKRQLAALRAEHPGAKLIAVLDQRSSSPIARLVAAVPVSSPWYGCLPDLQVTEILPELREAASAVVLNGPGDGI